ncbi:ABC transporter permease [Streptomyces avicenniae]|uniref:ABC transporter permease n=1 Tax=Streptomyces avicenniae TaxID=500153 RepID=UPI00069C6938|nr:ABC transporter permease [Streptomyces avicenniae]
MSAPILAPALAPSHVLTDSLTLTRRNLRHALRYPAMTTVVVGMPVLMLLVFTYAFGGALGEGIGTRGAYIEYVAPGIFLMAAASGAVATAVGLCMDMTEGIVNRFRTLRISRASIIAGHVLGTTLQTLVSIALVIAVAVAVGFRPDATPVEWLAAAGLLAFVALALSWVGAAMGLVARTPESASNGPLPLQFLPFLGSAVVPADSMPAATRWFAEHQPFTPVIETLRGLLTGTAIGTDGAVALAWCAGLTVVGLLWARVAFARAAAR